MSFEINGSAIVKDNPVLCQQVGIKERDIDSSEFENVLKKSMDENIKPEETDIVVDSQTETNSNCENKKLKDTNQPPANQEPPDQPKINQDKKINSELENEQDQTGEELNLNLVPNPAGTFVNVEAEPSSEVLVDDTTTDIQNVSDDLKGTLFEEIPAGFPLNETAKFDEQQGVLFQETELQDSSNQSDVEAKSGAVGILQNLDGQSEAAETNSLEDVSGRSEQNDVVKVDVKTVMESDLPVKADTVTDKILQDTSDLQDTFKGEFPVDLDSKNNDGVSQNNDSVSPNDKKTHQIETQNIDLERNNSSTEFGDQKINVANEKKMADVTESLPVEKVSLKDGLDDLSEPVKTNVIVENKSVVQNQPKKTVQDKETDSENELSKTVEDREGVSMNLANKYNTSDRDSNQQQLFQSSQQNAKADVNLERDIAREIIDFELNESAQSNKQSSQVDLNQKFVEKEVNAKRFEDIEELQKSISDQFRAQLKVSNSNEIRRSEIRFDIKPEHLGELSMRLTMENSSLIARIKVESQVVKEALELNIDDLRKNLLEQGLKVEKVEVTLKNDTNNMGSLDDRANKENIAREHIFNKNEKYTRKTEYNESKENGNVSSRVSRKLHSQDGRIDYLI